MSYPARQVRQAASLSRSLGWAHFGGSDKLAACRTFLADEKMEEMNGYPRKST